MKNILLLLMFFLSLVAKAQEFEAVEADVEEEFVIEESFDSETRLPKIKTEKINEIYSYYYNENLSSYRKTYGILKNGKMLLPQIFKREPYKSPTDKDKLILSINGLYGLFDLSVEKWTIQPSYKGLRRLKKGLYIAESNDGILGLVDSAQNLITKFKWRLFKELIGPKYFKVSETNNEGKFGLYNIEEKEQSIPCIYDYLGPSVSRDVFLVKKDNKYNLIDLQNKIQLSKWYDLINPLNESGLYSVKLEDKVGIINPEEKIVVPIKYLLLDKILQPDGSILALNSENYYGCINVNGNISLPFEYTSIIKNDRFLIVERPNNLKGVFTVSDKGISELIPCNYDEVMLKKNAFIVKKNGKYGMFDINGKQIANVGFDKIDKSEFWRKDKGLHVAAIKDKYFFINNDGQKVNKKTYKKMTPFENYLSGSYYSTTSIFYKVMNRKGGSGLADIYGKIVVPLVFDDVISGWDNFIVVKKDEKVGLYHILKKDVILPIKYDEIIFSSDGFYALEGNTFYKIAYDGTTSVIKL